MSETAARIDAEWITLNAVRDLAKIASRGDIEKSTYGHAIDLGAALYPSLLGPDVSLLRKERESDTAKEYRQRAALRSVREGSTVSPLTLIRVDLSELEDLLSIAERERDGKKRVDQLKKKRSQLYSAERELATVSHSENQLIFRDAYNVERNLPVLFSGKGHRDFQLPEERILRIRVLHPDLPEHITGADLIYEKHDVDQESVSIAAVQYKLWENKALYLSEPRMLAQIEKLTRLCAAGLCSTSASEDLYRFPYCCAFIRPTDKLQKADQRFFSTGEHLPVCRIKESQSLGNRNGAMLEYSKIRKNSLSSEAFEYLFNNEKIGSRRIRLDELDKVYSMCRTQFQETNVLVYAQEF